jgi:hypothetical protein
MATRDRPQSILLRLWAIVATTVMFVGCATGAIYTHTTVPLDTNFDRTPVFQKEADDSVNTLQYYIRVDWGNAAIGKIAKDHGFQRVYYADLETLSVLGFWTQQFVHIYGE